MISNAKYRRLSQTISGLPNVSQAVARMLRQMVFVIMQKTLVDGRTQSIPLKISTLGSKQPLTAQQLKVKPEGSRAWKWYMIHTLDDLGLKVNDGLIVDDVQYKVMGESNFSEYGYFYFEVIESTIHGN